jgi:hypothetical protein
VVEADQQQFVVVFVVRAEHHLLVEVMLLIQHPLIQVMYTIYVLVLEVGNV